jgi:hypothetical protein
VSGSTGVLDAVVVGEALELALGEADGLALGEALGLAEAEALLIALVEAEALEAGLAAALSSTPRSSIPLSSKPPSSPLAAATGANTDKAKAIDKTTNNHLRIVSPLFACTFMERMHRSDSYDLYKFMDLF